MNILETAIEAEKGVSNLARALGVKPNVVSNWRMRKQLSRAWELALTAKYKRHTKQAKPRTVEA